MRSKRSFSFNEETDAEKIYNNGFQNGTFDYSKMYLVAKYIRQTFGYGEIRLEKALIDFCKKQNESFNPITEARMIRKWVKSAMTYNLRKIDSVLVSQKEIDTLKNINNDKSRKLLFVTLVFSKALKKGNVKRKGATRLSDNHYIHYSNFIDIIRLSNLKNISETDLADIYSQHKDLFNIFSPEKELLRLEFVDKNPEKEIPVQNLKNVMEYYRIFFEQNKIVSYCERCRKEIIKNSNRQKLCKECAKIVSNEQHKLIMRKKRNE